MNKIDKILLPEPLSVFLARRLIDTQINYEQNIKLLTTEIERLREVLIAEREKYWEKMIDEKFKFFSNKKKVDYYRSSYDRLRQEISESYKRMPRKRNI